MIIKKVDKFPVDLLRYADRKITQECLDFYRSNSWFSSNEDNLFTGSNVLILTAVDEDDILLGVTASVVKDNEWVNSITVVHNAHRNQGVGTMLMKHKVQWEKRINHKAKRRISIASDNFSSLSMALKAGYEFVSASKHIRRNGKPYLRMELIHE